MNKLKKFSSDKNIHQLVKVLITRCGWLPLRRKTHLILKTPSGQTLTVPGSPSDRRSFRNFKSDVRRLQGI